MWEKGTADSRNDLGMEPRRFLDQPELSFKNSQKTVAETGPLLFLPLVGLAGLAQCST
jgi:hypothetical protein